MAFTFAHPAAVVPLLKHKNRFHSVALVLGAMAPDFEYFLYVKPLQVSGHTLLGLVTTNLPLVFLVWLIYEAFVRDAFLRHLPEPFWRGAQEYRRSPIYIRHAGKAWRFTNSALIGMLTHIVWDSFTHKSGFMVKMIPALRQNVLVLGSRIPVYKGLQHGSTLLGFLVIGLFLHAILRKQNRLVRTKRERIAAWSFWGAAFLLSGLSYVGFHLCFFDGSLGGRVMSILDSALLGIVMVSMIDRILGRELAVFFWGNEENEEKVQPKKMIE